MNLESCLEEKSEKEAYVADGHGNFVTEEVIPASGNTKGRESTAVEEQHLEAEAGDVVCPDTRKWKPASLEEDWRYVCYGVGSFRIRRANQWCHCRSVLLLLLLYTLQAIPLSLIAAIPLVLQERKGVSYRLQAVFSASHWAYGLGLSNP